MKKLIRCLTLAAGLQATASFAWQNGDTIYVNKAALGTGTGQSWNNAFRSIREAVLSVNGGTRVNIFVAKGTYFENNILLPGGVRLYGSFDGTESSLAERRSVWSGAHWTIIDGERKHRILRMRDKTEVNGFILRNGLRDYTLQSGVTLDDSRGGGIYVECDDDVVIRNNIIEHNAVFWQGGGIFIDGGCNNTPAAPLIEFNVVRSCTGYCGGGIEIAGVPEGAPGGTDAIIRHNVLRNNADGGTTELGFGLELWTEYDDQCSLRMGDFYNNIIVGFHNMRESDINDADVWAWARNSVDHSFISQGRWNGEFLYNGCYRYDNPANQNVFGDDPMFVDEASSDYRLRPGSPAIGAGRGGVDIGLFPSSIVRYGVFEQSFTHSGSYLNPYRDASATVTLVGPDGRSRALPLFWDGGSTWTLRFSPDVTGHWSFQVGSADPGLDGHAGVFDVVDGTGGGGIRRQSAFPRHFERQDGTPFWWMGDTQWSAFGSNPEEALDRASVLHYLDVRSAQGFNYVHASLMDPGSNEGGEIFASVGDETLNPAYFREVDARVQAMNDRGITAGIVLAWANGDTSWTSFGSDAARLRYARYVAARYAAYDVVFIVSGEWNEAGWPKADFDAIGSEIASADPHERLIGIHGTGSVEEFADEAWMSFGDYQQLYSSLHGSILAARDHAKPVVNSEYAYYLRDEDGDGIVDKPNSATLAEIRRATWDIAMAGGYFVTGWGTTYMGGINEPGLFNPDAPRNDDWEEDVQHVKALFGDLSWWTLEPQDQLLGGTGTRYCLARTGSQYVAYVRGASGALALSLGGAPAGIYDVRRFDPRTGLSSGLPAYTGSGPVTLSPPDSQDWVFVLTRTGAPLNQVPTVNAGPNRAVALPNAASLDGTVTDDGLPNPPGALTTAWSRVSGPGTVTFSNAAAVDTTAGFSVAGTYVLRLTAGDGALAASDDMTVTVAPQPVGAFGYRRLISIDYTKVAQGCTSNLASFPVLVKIANDVSLKTKSQGGRVSSSKGYDIIFKSADGQTQFPHQMEKYDGTAGTLWAWVKVPVVYYSQNTNLYIYYGNANVTVPTEIPASVWGNGYKAVWHLKEDPSLASPQVKDSTSSGLDGTARGGMTTSDRVSGKITYGLDLDGADDFVDLGDSMNDLPLPFSIEGWLYHRGTPPCPDCPSEVIAASDDGPTYSGFWFQLEGGTYQLAVSYGDGKGLNSAFRRSKHSTKTITPGVWTHVAAVVRGAQDMILYINGNQVGGTYSGTGGSMAHSSGAARLGGRGSQLFNGILDEVRISNVARGTCWVKTGYLNQNNPSTFHTVGAEEAVP